MQDFLSLKYLCDGTRTVSQAAEYYSGFLDDITSFKKNNINVE